MTCEKGGYIWVTLSRVNTNSRQGIFQRRRSLNNIEQRIYKEFVLIFNTAFSSYSSKNLRPGSSPEYGPV